MLAKALTETSRQRSRSSGTPPLMPRLAERCVHRARPICAIIIRVRRCRAAPDGAAKVVITDLNLLLERTDRTLRRYEELALSNRQVRLKTELIQCLGPNRGDHIISSEPRSELGEIPRLVSFPVRSEASATTATSCAFLRSHPLPVHRTAA
jgi:hypothetical protein